MNGYRIVKTYLVWFVLATILVVFASFGFGDKHVRNAVCPRIAEEVRNQNDRLVLFFGDLCKPPEQSVKTAAGDSRVVPEKRYNCRRFPGHTWQGPQIGC